MGNCGNVITHQTNKRTYQLCPNDTGAFDKSSSLRKNYEGVLSGVKIQSVSSSLQNSEFGIDFTIDDEISMSCPLSKPHQRTIRWFISKQFKLFLNDYQIRTKFLKISIISQQNKKVDAFKINLYRILSGPFHHDFNIGSKNKSYGRLIFDLRLSEIIQVELNTLNAKINLNKQHQGDKFNFVIQSHINKNLHEKTHKDRLEYKSIPSYKQEVPFSIQTSKSQSVLRWSRAQKDQMPWINFQIKSSEVLSTVFTMKLNKFLDDRKFTQFGQFGFTLSELMSTDTSNNDQLNGRKQYKMTRIVKNLNTHGKIQGNCQVELEIKFDKFIVQALNSCLTEDGIVSMHHHEHYKAHSENQSESSLKSCLTNILVLTQQKPSSSSLVQRSAVSSSISIHLRELHSELLKNSKHSSVYKDRKCQNLHDKKVLLVEILDTLAYLIEENDIQLSQLCWHNVIAVMGRAQMMLKYWQFDQDQEREMTLPAGRSSKSIKIIQDKIDVSLQYIRVLHKLLKLALDTEIENSINSEKKHGQIFKAYCYFRIPRFRRKLLTSIDAKIQNASPLSKKLSNIQVLGLNNQQIPLELDWFTRFQSVLLAKVEKTQQLYGQLNQLLQNHEWFGCVVDIQQNQAYCNFVRYLLAKFAQARQMFKLQKWVYFQGYSVIVKGFLYNLFTIQLCNYENYLIITIMFLLENDKLTSLLIQTLFKKTNLFDLSSILRLAFVLTHILHALTKNKYLQNFPYVALMSPIKEILESDHSLASSYFLTFLYTFYEKFQKTFRYQLGSYLLGKLFWKLCYSWSHNLRKIFYHFVVLKIGQDQILLSSTDMSQKLAIVCNIITNGERVSLNKNKNVSSQKYLHQALKKKLIDKKKAALHQIDIKFLQQRSPISFSELSKTVDDPQFKLQIVNYNNINPLDFREQSENIERPPLTGKDMNKAFKPSTELYKTPRFQKKMTYLMHKLFYPCFQEPDFIIPELDQKYFIQRNMQEYMKNSGKQFRNVINTAEKHFMKYETLPTIQFQFKVQVDQKDILPDDFQDMYF